MSFHNALCLFRLNNCNRISIKPLTSLSTDSIKRMFMLIEFIFLILTPIASAFGIVSNLLVIIVVQMNSKELKENHYKYMWMNSLINVLYLVIQPFNLISECQQFDGWFCSSVRKFFFSQYFKIIFVEYVSNLLRLLSNFTYAGFCINRSSLIGQEHSKLTIYVSNLSINKYLLRIFIPCMGLSTVEIFKFMPNTDKPEYLYPLLFMSRLLIFKRNVPFCFILIFTLLNDFINSFFFLIVNLVIDVNLVIKMKKTLLEKSLKFEGIFKNKR